jgi:diguanylate cyclase (GGDEF)-like protein
MNNPNLNRLPETILIVDDSSDNLRLLSTMLQSQGYQVKKAISGAFALQSLELIKPDLILLDVNMPGLNGYEVCEAIKAQESYQTTPVIFISASNEVFNKVKAFELGAIDYITKPFHLEEVLIRVENQLNQKRLYQALKQQNTLLENEITERRRIESQLKKANHKLELLASLDGLTGLANRRRFDEYLATEWQRCLRGNFPLSLILIDVDFFKAYNDTYGHILGDECLKKIACILQNASQRATDLAARYGGEEFVIVLPHTPQPGAVELARSIQKAVAAQKIPHHKSLVSVHITLSLGIASIQPGAGSQLPQFVEGADQALYQAKIAGRNRIACFTPTECEDATV